MSNTIYTAPVAHVASIQYALEASDHKVWFVWASDYEGAAMVVDGYRFAVKLNHHGVVEVLFGRIGVRGQRVRHFKTTEFKKAAGSIASTVKRVKVSDAVKTAEHKEYMARRAFEKSIEDKIPASTKILCWDTNKVQVTMSEDFTAEQTPAFLADLAILLAKYGITGTAKEQQAAEDAVVS